MLCTTQRHAQALSCERARKGGTRSGKIETRPCLSMELSGRGGFQTGNFSRRQTSRNGEKSLIIGVRAPKPPPLPASPPRQPQGRLAFFFLGSRGSDTYITQKLSCIKTTPRLVVVSYKDPQQKPFVQLHESHLYT